MKTKGKHRKIREGLTLIEITVVMLILGSLMAILYSSIGNRGEGEKKLKLKNDSAVLKTALERYLEVYDKYPTEEQGLQALIEKPDDDKIGDDYEPIVREKAVLKDPWKTPYVLKFEGAVPQILTLGEDKKEGGEGKNKDFNILSPDDYPAAFR
ncbi:type II secretion system protein GspG [Leptospira sp. 85282-16]|uniref:Type II secretion system protein GspG n=2 Tax=Leptospira TaxID=171 RepID=A0AAW5VIH3_9LEPT|nr:MULTISPECIES: type II secretion system protein GspG [Leptospira]MCT8332560.1 type II secretion system protein GspG [Leptospira sp. 85282-16]MCW7492204.1 type II secretion system protein GspG [Leptospira soteropolitanensis]MCW7499786.1 type II secretion system protein GspG [Leptospira soteropolitanensis]MCW7522037.1 type II secretion system protein GspG [Leptospira soteropolitanensis]MCW7525891.1 type II secretion system protein GspG [Leptospira soteropolitanensis]